MENVYWAAGFVLACIALYKFGLPVLKRFDAENVARINQQEQDKSDPSAHIRHALQTAEEQVEPVTEIRTGDTVQYLFEAQIFSDRDDAEEARTSERHELAQLYQPGQSLWRVPISHFSKYDFNWPYGCAQGNAGSALCEYPTTAPRQDNAGRSAPRRTPRSSANAARNGR